MYCRPTGGSNVLGAGRYKPDQLTEAVSSLLVASRLPKILQQNVETSHAPFVYIKKISSHFGAKSKKRPVIAAVSV